MAYSFWQISRDEVVDIDDVLPPDEPARLSVGFHLVPIGPAAGVDDERGYECDDDNVNGCQPVVKPKKISY